VAADLILDFRYAVRVLLRQKIFAATAILTLALGIGANTALFSVVSGVILRPLPLADPERLVQLAETTALSPRGEAVTWSNLDAYRRESTSFEQLVGYDVSARYLRGGADPERVMVVRAERGFFAMLGVAPIAGRTFRDDDPPTVAVVSETFWKQRLGANASIVGRSITLDDEPLTIVGVMPESFQFPYGAASILPGAASEVRSDLWTVASPPPQPRIRISHVTGRLKPNVSIVAAGTELSAIAKRLDSESPNPNSRGVRLVPLSDAVVPATVRRPLLVLLGAVGLVLALACANLTNLLLARMTLRVREVAMRAALGASPRRLARLFLVESVVLSLAGGALGLALAWWGTSRLMVLVRTQIPRAHEVGLDWRVFLFQLVVCAIAAALFGLAPAVIAMRTDARSALQESGGPSTTGRGQRRLLDGLVVLEVALAFVLAAGATLLVRELVRLRDTDAGMSPSNVLTVHVGQRMTPRTDPHSFYQIADRVAQLPGVRAAGFTQLLPLQNWGWTSNSSEFTRRGQPPGQTARFPIELRYITPGYFQALGITVRRGRGFTERDIRGAPPVIVINETLARRYFGDDDPVGITMSRGTIVGLIADVRQVHLDRSAAPEIYYPIAQNWSQVSELGMSLVVRTQERPEAFVGQVRDVVRDVDPNLAVFSVKTMERVIADSLSEFTLFLMLMGTFAALAILLAGTGAYGVIACLASSRTREFAIRLALGADGARVARLVLGHGVRITALGLGVGLFAAFAIAPLLRTLPVTVRPPDAATTAPVALLIALVAVVACLVPAWRASRVDPMTMLKRE